MNTARLVTARLITAHLIAVHLIALIWLFCAAPAQAQDLPDWQHTSINDFAGLLTNEDTKALDQTLIALHDETGVEGTVVTLTDRARYGGSDGLEPFATRLFNDWGVGDAKRNDGFMVLVLQNDRETRIELGAGYPASADAIAREIIDTDMLPAFRADRMSQGIRNGTDALIARIARPHAQGQALQGPASSPVDTLLSLIPFGIFALAAISIGYSFFKRSRFGRQPCPQCGGRGLIEEVSPVTATDEKGASIPRESVWTRCPRCGWSRHDTRDRPAHRRSSIGSSGFGGGRSSGGGASGRW